MGQPHRPKKGSHGFTPRKRADGQVPRLTSWPVGGDAPKLQGFAGYKAGMTHAFVVDYRPTSTTSGHEVQIPLTVIDTAPMKVAAVRVYRHIHYSLRLARDHWTQALN